ncbi:MAG: hypothetical protein KTR14_03050 [Vampirovibrio sp.]|nr:hypothetical protein [Vampirovibrio sp.]
MHISPVLRSTSQLTSQPFSVPRFGLKGEALKSHPAYNYQLQEGRDLLIDAQGDIRPTEALIDLVTQNVSETTLDKPRAIVLTGITNHINNFEYKQGSAGFQKIHAFQDKLFDAVWQNVHQSHYPKTRREDFLIHKVNVEHSRTQHEERQPVNAPESIRSVKYPVPHVPHLPADDAFDAISIGPVSGIKGGNFRLMDFTQYLTDKGFKFREVFHHLSSAQTDGWLVRPEHQGDKLDPYLVDIPVKDKHGKPEVPLLFVNGRKIAQALGPTEPLAQDFRSRHHQLLLYRSSVRPKRQSSHWQQVQPFAYHDFWHQTNRPPDEGADVSQSPTGSKFSDTSPASPSPFLSSQLQAAIHNWHNAKK